MYQGLIDTLQPIKIEYYPRPWYKYVYTVCTYTYIYIYIKTHVCLRFDTW